ncbi:cGMP-dependent protein kinase (PbPKG) [Durusdinium trenchii]
MSTLAVETELGKLQMFTGCSQELLADLSQAAQSIMCGEQLAIHAKGDQSDAILIVLRGTVDVRLGDECILQLRKGDHLGETLFLAVEDYWPVQLVSSSLSMVCEISREDLLTVLKDYPADKELLNPYLSQPPHVHLLTSERMLQIPLFAGISESAWETFRDSMLRRIFFPGEIILSEDTAQQDLVLLARGAVSIDIAGRTIRVERRGESLRGLSQREGMEMDMISPDDALHPAVFNDLEFLGLAEQRVSTIKADAECHCWLLPHTSLTKAFTSGERGERDSLLWELASLFTDPGRVAHARLRVLNIFDEAGCSQEFLQYLEEHFEPRIYLQGKTICDFEVPAGTRVMHIVTSGLASTVAEDERIRTLSSSTTFGMMAALGVAPRPERVKKVVAVEHCSCQLLHQAVVVRALELFPDQRMKVLTLSNGGQETDMSDLIDRIQNSPFFNNTHPDFVIELANSAVDRIFMPGDLVVNEGEVGNSMYILLNGNADVYVSDKSKDKQDKADTSKKNEPKKIKQMIRVGHLAPGAIAGELAMLGISQTRSASIQASTLCVFWEVTQERAMLILDHFPEERQLFSTVIVQNLDLTVPGRMMNLPLFKSFDRKFRNLLGLYCERHAFFPDYTPTREGETGDKLWIMNSGPVMLQKKGFRVKMYLPGMHFGCDNMLGLSRQYMGTLVAMTVSHILSLSRSSYLHALEQYPSKAAHQKLLKAQKREANELREMLDRVAVRKGVWQRYQGELAGALGMNNLPDNELIRRVVQGWHDRVRIVREKRLQEGIRHDEMLNKLQGFKQKTAEGKKRIEQKSKLKELIKWNITERGPLKYLEEEKKPDPIQQSRVQTIQDWQEASDPWANETSWPRSSQNHAMLKDWPQPRPSPNYRLHVWDIVRQELRSQECGTPSKMLPLLGTKGKRDESPDSQKGPIASGRRRSAAAQKFRTGVKAVLLTRLLSSRPVSEFSDVTASTGTKSLAATM